MRNRSIRARILALLLAALWLLSPAALAEEPRDVFIAPKLSQDADPYDPEHPENLSEDQLYAQSAIVVEASSGKVIFEKNADNQMYPASTTKVLTVLLGATYGDLAADVTLDSIAGDIPSDSSTIPLEIGETVNFSDLLYATMVRSGNEGANLIAEAVSGNINDFVGLMNQAAATYGCTGTHFANPSGYHDENHYTTARDMAIIACAAMQNPLFRDIAKTYTYSMPRTNLHRSRVLVMSNGGDSFINPREDNEFFYFGSIGIKTGYHSKAGYCYVAAAERDGVELITVVLYTTKDGRWIDTSKLMDYGFSQFVSVTPVDIYNENPIVVETSGFSMSDTDLGRLPIRLESTGDVAASIVATKAEVSKMASDLKKLAIINYTRDFSCPISEGEPMGTFTYTAEDGSQTVYNMLAGRSIAKRENAPKTLAEIEEMVNSDPNPLPPMSVDLVLILLAPLAVLFVLVKLLMSLFHRGGGRHRKSRVPKPSNRYFR